MNQKLSDIYKNYYEVHKPNFEKPSRKKAGFRHWVRKTAK